MKKADFKVGDKARVILGSSVDRERGDVVVMRGYICIRGRRGQIA